MHLPHSQKLPVNLLSAVFNRTTATYKYYWLLALIESVEQGKLEISKRELFSRMISASWYTINYFHLSFGAFDMIEDAILKIRETEGITIDENRTEILNQLLSSNNKETVRVLNHFDKNVPHWFLSPWFPNKSKKDVYNASQDFEKKAIYGLEKDFIKINPLWQNYLTKNSKILKEFCYWNLALFLQTRNPNVPDIPNKLIKPATRNSLVNQTKDYWKLVFKEMGSIECIFTGNRLDYSEKNFAIDHFVPYAFVSHDLIWNLAPVDRTFNLSKSDRLPSFDVYFHKFKELQKNAFEIHLSNKSSSKFLDEYLTIFPSINSFDEKLFENTIQPLLTIANNNGFLYF